MGDYVLIDEYGSLFKVNISENGLFICPLCGAKFFSVKDLISHIIFHFSTERELKHTNQ